MKVYEYSPSTFDKSKSSPINRRESEISSLLSSIPMLSPD